MSHLDFVSVDNKQRLWPSAESLPVGESYSFGVHLKRVKVTPAVYPRL